MSIYKMTDFPNATSHSEEPPSSPKAFSESQPVRDDPEPIFTVSSVPTSIGRSLSHEQKPVEWEERKTLLTVIKGLALKAVDELQGSVAEVAFGEYEISFSRRFAERVAVAHFSSDGDIFVWNRSNPKVLLGAISLSQSLLELPKDLESSIIQYLSAALPVCDPLPQALWDTSRHCMGRTLICKPKASETVRLFLSVNDLGWRLDDFLSQGIRGSDRVGFLTNWPKECTDMRVPVLLFLNKYTIRYILAPGELIQQTKTFKWKRGRDQPVQHSAFEAEIRSMRGTLLYDACTSRLVRSSKLGVKSVSAVLTVPSLVNELESHQGQYMRLYQSVEGQETNECVLVAVLNLLYVSRGRPLPSPEAFFSSLAYTPQHHVIIPKTLEKAGLLVRILCFNVLRNATLPAGLWLDHAIEAMFRRNRWKEGQYLIQLECEDRRHCIYAERMGEGHWNLWNSWRCGDQETVFSSAGFKLVLDEGTMSTVWTMTKMWIVRL